MVVGKQTCAAVVNQKQIGGLLFFFFNQILRLYGWGCGVVNQMKKSCESNRF